MATGAEGERVAAVAGAMTSALWFMLSMCADGWTADEWVEWLEVIVTGNVAMGVGRVIC